MFTHPHDKEVFRDSAFNRSNNVPSLSSRIPGQEESFSKPEKDQEVFSKLPSIPSILEKDKKREGDRTVPSLLVNGGTDYTGEGSSPYLIRSSMYTVPADEDLFELVGLPLFSVVQPFNSKVPIPEYRASYLPRCKECSSFPTADELKDSSYKFKCTLCGTVNEISQDLPYPLDYTTEYICEGPALKSRSWYSSDTLPKTDAIALPSCRKWAEPCLIFMIDCSAASRSTPGYTEYISGMKSVLLLSEISLFYRRFAVLLITESVYVVSDGEMGYSVNVMYSVKGDYGLCAPLFIETESITEESVDALIRTVESIPSGQFTTTGAVTAAVQMTAYTGGSKVLSWLGSQEYAEVPDSLLQAAVDCGVSLNVFCNKGTKLEKIYKTVFTTGRAVEREMIKQGVVSKAVQESFFRCSIRVVTSNGIKKRAVYSSGSSENISMVTFPEMNSSTTFAVSFSVEEFLKEGAPIYIQAIIEYTSMTGESKTRVLNMRMKASRLIQQIFTGISLDTLFCGMCKYICSAPLTMVDNIRKAESAMTNALSLYKRSCAKDTAYGQLVLPDAVKGLPVLIQSFLKYPKVHLDLLVRIELAGEIMPLPVDRTFRMFYPRLVKMSSLFMVSSIGEMTGDRLSMRYLDMDESYLLDAGGKVVLWFVRAAAEMADEMSHSEVVSLALDRLKEIYGVELKVTCCVQGEMDAEFIGYMIEDQMGGYSDYQEYLGHLHGKIVKK